MQLLQRLRLLVAAQLNKKEERQMNNKQLSLNILKIGLMGLIFYTLWFIFFDNIRLYDEWKNLIIEFKNWNLSYNYYIDIININIAKNNFFAHLGIFIVAVLSGSFLFFLNILPSTEHGDVVKNIFELTSYEKVCLIIFWMFFINNLNRYYPMTWDYFLLEEKISIILNVFTVTVLLPLAWLYSSKNPLKINLPQSFILVLGILMLSEFFTELFFDYDIYPTLAFFLISFTILFFLFPLSNLSKWFERKYFTIKDETRLIFSILLVFLGITVWNIESDPYYSLFAFTMAFLVVFPYIFNFAKSFFKIKSDLKTRITFILTGIIIYSSILVVVMQEKAFKNLTRICQANQVLLENYEHIPNMMTKKIDFIFENGKISSEDIKIIKQAGISYSELLTLIENLPIPSNDDVEIKDLTEKIQREFYEQYGLRLDTIKDLNIYIISADKRYFIEAEHEWQLAKSKKDIIEGLFTKINGELSQKMNDNKLTINNQIQKMFK